MKDDRKFDLEDRLINHAVRVINLSDSLGASLTGKYIASQIIRSGCSPALNYAEAKSAESLNDFLHKMKICLKELRETLVTLKIVEKIPLTTNKASLTDCLSECNELISIFVKSIKTAEKRKAK